MASGYLVKPGATKIGTNNGHAWTVDQFGDREDVTPGKNITAEDAAYLDREPVSLTEGQLNVPLLPLGVGLVGAMGLALAYRRREALPRAYQDMQAKRAVRIGRTLIQETDESGLSEAIQVSNAALYDPAQDVKAAIKRARASVKQQDGGALHPIVSAKVLAEKMIHEAPSKGASTAIKAIETLAKRPENRGVRSELRRAVKTLRRARFIKQHPPRPAREPRF